MPYSKHLSSPMDILGTSTKKKTLETLKIRPYVNGFPLGYYDYRTLCVIMIYGLYVNSKFEIVFVATLALGLRPRQRVCKGAGQD